MNRALLAAAATGVQVGAAIVASRFVVGEVPPLTLALLRYAVGFLCLAPFAWPVLKLFLAHPSAGRSLSATASGVLDLAVMAALGIGQFAVLIALLLGEAVEGWTLAAIACIGGGLWLATRTGSGVRKVPAA